jgi:hypothetical protein
MLEISFSFISRKASKFGKYSLTNTAASAAICGLQRIKGNLLVRFEPTNLRIVYLKDYLRKLKYVYLNSWVGQ